MKDCVDSQVDRTWLSPRRAERSRVERSLGSRSLVALLAAVLLLLTSCSSVAADQSSDEVGATQSLAGDDISPPAQDADDVGDSAGALTTVPSPPTSAPLEVHYAEAANPSVVRIPSIDVSAPIIPLGLRDDGSIEVPEIAEETGWWQDGPEPGEAGPAVILGHVDSYTGPAVFFRLRDLEPGAVIHVDRIDGTTVSYTVDRIQQYDKDQFPTEEVYGAQSEPVLRLVTCGGLFDREIRSYTDNLVVYASLLV